MFDRLTLEFQSDPNVLAVVVIGSAARGDMDAFSDVDVHVVVRDARPPDRRFFRDGRLTNINFLDRANREAMLTDPWYAMWNILPTIGARVLFDPDGWYANLQARARAFRWSDVADKANDSIGYLLVERIEEVMKVLGALEHHRPEKALLSINRIIAGLANATVMARGVLILTENSFYSSIAAAEPDARWGKLLWAALGMNAEPVQARARAALRLYALSVDLYGSRCSAGHLEMARIAVERIRGTGVL